MIPTTGAGGAPRRMAVPRMVIPRRVTGSYPYRQPPAPARPAPRQAPRQAPLAQSLSQQATQAADQQLAPQLAAQQAYAAAQNNTIQGFAQALLGKLQPIAGQVGQDYDQAINQTGQLSAAAAQYLSNANPSGQVADLLRSAGAPQGQIDQQTAQLGQAFGGGAGVLSFLGGAVPGANLAGDKAAAQAQAAQLPGLAALRGEQDLASALGQQSVDRQKLEATRPGLYQSALSDLGTQQYDQQRLAQGAAQNRETAAYHAASIRSRNQATTASSSARAASLAEQKRYHQETVANKQAALTMLQWYRTQGVHLSEEKVSQKWQQIQDNAHHQAVTEGQGAARVAQGQERVGIAAQRAADTAAHQRVTEQQAQARIAQGAARNRIAQQRADQAIQKQRTKNSLHGLTANEVRGLRGKALTGARAAFNGWDDKDGHHDPLPYDEAVAHAEDAGIPKWLYTPVLDSFYRPGGTRSPLYGPPAPKGK